MPLFYPARFQLDRLFNFSILVVVCERKVVVRMFMFGARGERFDVLHRGRKIKWNIQQMTRVA